MSEKRFVLCKKGDVEYIKDNGCVQLYGFDVICEMLNEQQELIEKLRLQEKNKGVSVFVVRESKNPIALFFNEQRASLYCQENMANLTYQQEKWCREE